MAAQSSRRARPLSAGSSRSAEVSEEGGDPRAVRRRGSKSGLPRTSVELTPMRPEGPTMRILVAATAGWRHFCPPTPTRWPGMRSWSRRPGRSGTTWSRPGIGRRPSVTFRRRSSRRRCGRPGAVPKGASGSASEFSVRWRRGRPGRGCRRSWRVPARSGAAGRGRARVVGAGRGAGDSAGRDVLHHPSDAAGDARAGVLRSGRRAAAHAPPPQWRSRAAPDTGRAAARLRLLRDRRTGATGRSGTPAAGRVGSGRAAGRPRGEHRPVGTRRRERVALSRRSAAPGGRARDPRPGGRRGLPRRRARRWPR